ncbi:MAG: hypothetical protein A4E42_02290 [Methanoregulaceae archaeon PtaU1.Bin222]|nr:MAG: hypothetical protein A4E42_02290 [Methanoregulaceae archaeon PtaU1.Bin222]
MQQVIDDILIGIFLPRDILAFRKMRERLHLVAEQKRPLVVMGPGPFFHLLFKRSDDLRGISLQDERCLPHQYPIVFRTDPALTGCTACPERCAEATPLGHLPAAPEPECLLDDREDMIPLRCGSKRPEVGSFLCHPSGNADSREFIASQMDEGILLGIL